ncbi:MAG TPA: M14 family metallopeptidase [Acidimicrobiales bacterium]|nr:M14 family metallopeptidase [Acidimicrobiales bacterium]
MTSVRFDRYPRFPELTQWLHELADEHPDLVELTSIGTSFEGRDLWLATVTNRATGPHDEKPAVWLDGNIHAREVTASVAMLHLVHHLCTGYGSDERITHALDRRTFYVLPRMNPDGAEVALAEVPRFVRSTTRPWPRADQLDGLVRGDVDLDGRALQMRIADPNGTWVPCAADPRLLVPRAPDDLGSGPAYRLLPEGRVHGYDGITVAPAPPLAGIDSNRNFPIGWRRFPEGSFAPQGNGDYPTSEPEVRAVVQAVVDRPNIVAYFAHHTYSGVHLRPYGDRADDAFPTVDLWTYDELGRHLTSITGYPHIGVWNDFRYDPKDVISGVGDDWAYDQRGLFAWTTELWSALRAAGLDDAHPIEWFRDHPLDEELQLLAWVDEHAPDGYVDWYRFDHPELGPVELGGWNHAAVFDNPPVAFLEAEVAPQSDAAVFVALVAPELRHRETRVERVGDDAWRVRVVVENTGWLPTQVTEQAVRQRVTTPIEARLTLADGTSLVSGSERIELGQLAGRVLRHSSVGMFQVPNDATADRAVAEWIVRGPAGARLDVEVRQPRAGVVRAEVTLAE